MSQKKRIEAERERILRIRSGVKAGFDPIIPWIRLIGPKPVALYSFNPPD